MLSFSFLRSQFLYDLTKSAGTAPVKTTIEAWLHAIGDQLGCALRFTERLGRVIVNRANHIQSKMRAVKGGAGRRKFLQQSWKVRLAREEVIPQADFVEKLQGEATQLKERVNLVEGEKAESDFQCDTLQRESSALREQNSMIQAELKKVSEERDSLKKGSVQLADQLFVTSTGGPRHKRRDETEYSQSHQRRLKRRRVNSCELSLRWLQMESYTPTKLELIKNSTGEAETLQLAQDILGPEGDTLTQDDLDMINMLLLVKDRYHVFGRAYHEMASICKEMPRHYKIKQRIRTLNELWAIKATPNGTVGVQQSLRDRLQVRLRRLLDTAPADALFRKSKRTRVKLSGDGTMIGKRLHVENFTFTLLDEGSAAYSSEGNHILVIAKVPEDYDSLKNVLEDLVRETQEVTTIEVEEEIYSITYYLGGDWKFLAIVTGIDCATSKYACIWCKCSMTERGDLQKKWSISDTEFGARTIQENKELSSRPKSKKQFNVSNPPLFPNIPLVNVVIDNLHLFLRVSDVLINHLIEEFRRQDAIDKVKTFSSFETSKYKHLQEFERYVAGFGIPNYRFYTGRLSKQLKWRTLIGPEKLKLFKHISIPQLLPSVTTETTERMQELWKRLLQVNELLSKRPEDVTQEEIIKYETLSREWGLKYLELYQTKEVTPYIHAMICHVGEFMRIHGCILSFTQQGLEKYNDCMTKDYFRGSSHKGVQALFQIMQKNKTEWNIYKTRTLREQCTTK